jgi:hypothetical protein
MTHSDIRNRTQKYFLSFESGILLVSLVHYHECPITWVPSDSRAPHVREMIAEDRALASDSTTSSSRKTMERIKQLASQFTASSGRAHLEVNSLDDVVITLAIRSPMCKVEAHQSHA